MSYRIGSIIAAILVAGCSTEPKGTLYTGTFSGPYVETFTKDGQTCVVNFTLNGSVSVRLTSETGSVSGEGNVTGTETVGAVTSNASLCGPQAVNHTIDLSGSVTGTPSSLQFAANHTSASPVFVRNSVSFTGSLASGVVSGQLTISRTQGPHASGMTGLATATMNVTLR